MQKLKHLALKQLVIRVYVKLRGPFIVEYTVQIERADRLWLCCDRWNWACVPLELSTGSTFIEY